MKGLLQVLGGVTLGAALGAGIYLLLTNEEDEGFLSDLKSLLDEVIEEGKRAAEQRRLELEQELRGQRMV
ncbi:MAG: hypothetical protein D6791_09175 [Chloroflexi bacterium]|nr:MAG: hypothetical protein D6791_09175 [Chloroflexota bacterium]